MITVTRPWLPSRDKLNKYIDRIYETKQLTNNGCLVRELEERLAKFLGVRHVILVANGTSALQVAYRALNIEGEVITSPFSFVATASSMVWQNITPRFCDIDTQTFTLNAQHVERKINKNTSAIVPVHVFGNPCDVSELAEVASRHNLKLVYDASHCFAVRYNNKSILSYGDVSTLSFHATKLFHTCEGGAIVTDNETLAKDIRNRINFGITGMSQVDTVGINAKMNELEAAMGHAVLDDIEVSISSRKEQVGMYRDAFYDLVRDGYMHLQHIRTGTEENFAYLPVVLNSEVVVEKLDAAFRQNGILARRYFHPSLDTLAFINPLNDQCAVSQEIAKRILCLPLYAGLSSSEQKSIISIIRSILLSDL